MAYITVIAVIGRWPHASGLKARGRGGKASGVQVLILPLRRHPLHLGSLTLEGFREDHCYLERRGIVMLGYVQSIVVLYSGLSFWATCLSRYILLRHCPYHQIEALPKVPWFSLSS